MAKAQETAANGKSVMDCFVAGIDPNGADSVFRAVIAMDGDEPVITTDPAEIKGWRVYRLWGANELGGKYEEVPKSCERNFRFFKVTVGVK